jgi:hypothetical protein
LASQLVSAVKNIANELVHNAPIDSINSVCGEQRELEQGIMSEAISLHAKPDKPNAVLNDYDLANLKAEARLLNNQARQLLVGITPACPVSVVLASAIASARNGAERQLLVGLAYALTGEFMRPSVDYNADADAMRYIARPEKVV